MRPQAEYDTKLMIAGAMFVCGLMLPYLRPPRVPGLIVLSLGVGVIVFGLVRLRRL